MKRRSFVWAVTVLLLVSFLPLGRFAAAAELPAGPAEILALYRTAVEQARVEAPGCTRSSWQSVGDLNLTEYDTVDSVIKALAAQYLTPESAPKKETYAEGSADAAAAIPACTLTDVSKITDAACTKNGEGNYAIRLVLADEDTPLNRETSVLGQITDNVIYKNAVNAELSKLTVVQSADYSVLYRGFTVECELQPDGRLIYLQHHANILITLRSVNVFFVPIRNKTVEMTADAAWYDFSYPARQPALRGDVNCSGDITAEDARLALRAAVGLEGYLPGFAAFTAADWDKDETITAADARFILRAAVGLEPTDPPADPAAPAEPDEQIVALAEKYRAALEKTRALHPGYTTLMWQYVPELHLTGVALVDDRINNEILDRISSADHPEGATYDKNTAEAAKNLPPFTLTDYSRIVSASEFEEEGVTTVTLVLAEETDPKGGESFLGQVTNDIIFREDIDREIAAISAIPETPDFHVTYKNLTLTAEILPDGTLRELRHHVDAEIRVNRAKILLVTLSDQLVTMESDIRYFDFTY